MKISLQDLKIEDNGRRVGRYYFLMNILHMAIEGAKVRIIKGRARELIIFLKPKDGFKFLVVGHVKDSVLEYEGKRYEVSIADVNDSKRPCIFSQELERVIAFSNLDGSMEFSAEKDPVLIGLGILCLCLIRIPTEGTPGIHTYIDGIYRMFEGKWRKVTTVIPLIITFSTVILVLLSQVFATGIWSKVLVGGFAAVLIGAMVFLAIVSFRRKPIIIPENKTA